MPALLPDYVPGTRLPPGAEPYAGAVREILARHGLPDAPVERPSGGSVPVLAAGGSAVKLFPPPFAVAAATEAAALAHVHGRLGIPTPRVLGTGGMDGWHYVAMERLPGSTLFACWDEVPEADRHAIAERLGEAVARLHALPVDDLAGVPRPEWEAFIRDQSASCAERQRKLGVPEEWVARIDPFLASVPLPATGRRSLLHTELMREHVLVERRNGRWEITGLFDFEPAMVGDPEYDLASVVTFLALGSPALLRSFLRGYGVEPDPGLRRRVGAYGLLHRYANLRWNFDLLQPRATTFEELGEEWWGPEETA